MNWKRVFFVLAAIVVALGLTTLWLLLGPATRFKESAAYVYVRTTDDPQTAVMQQLQQQQLIRGTALFEWMAGRLHVWERLPAGKYKIEKGTSLLQLLRTLRNRRQEPVDLVIVKLRTRQQFAALVGRRFACDSACFMRYLSDNDSLAHWNADTATLMALVRPNTYTYYWAATPRQILKKIADENERFWTEERKQAAQKIGLTPLQVVTLASIIEEETNRHDEKPLIASVYLNRLRAGMPLGADPTVKFATGDFGLRRILLKHINETAQSPYNTYRRRGLPPGPICTPGVESIDAVLHAPATNYLYFCARPDGSGYHAFAATYNEHLVNARAYQQWLNSLQQ